MTYNGWANKETWLTNVWLYNDPHTSVMIDDLVRREVERGQVGYSTSAERVAEELRGIVRDMAMPEDVEDSTTGFLADLVNCALANVDFYELAENYAEDAQALRT